MELAGQCRVRASALVGVWVKHTGRGSARQRARGMCCLMSDFQGVFYVCGLEEVKVALRCDEHLVLELGLASVVVLRSEDPIENRLAVEQDLVSGHLALVL